MTKRLVLLGGGHAHMLTLASLKAFLGQGVEVVVVQQADCHYYSGMAPGMLGGTYAPRELRFATRELCQRAGARFVCARVMAVDAQAGVVHLDAQPSPLAYDVLSCNLGSEVAPAFAFRDGEPVFPVKPIAGLRRLQEELQRHAGRGGCRVAIVGGGPSAVEIAGNIMALQGRVSNQGGSVALYAGRRLLPAASPRLRALVRRLLIGKGVAIVEGNRVSAFAGGELTLDGGGGRPADLVVAATGVRPSPVLAASGLGDGEAGAMVVNQYLQSVRAPDIFGGGDCIDFHPRKLAKVGVHAVRQNPVLRDNLMARLKGGVLRPFRPRSGYLLIYNLGGGEGVLCRGPLILSGRFPFLLKNFIDKRFIRKFSMTAE